MQQGPQQQSSFQPQAPVPPPPPPPTPPKRSFWRRKVGCMPMWLLIGLIGLFLLIALGQAANGQGVGYKSTTPTDTPTSVPTDTPTSAPTDTPTDIPTDTPTTQPVAPAATHSTPHIVGPLADFYGKYGKPNNTDANGGPNFAVSDSIFLSADGDQGGGSAGTVNRVSVSGPDSWSMQKTQEYCSQFLPSDASLFNADKNSSDTWYLDYHASGASNNEVVLSVYSQGACLLTEGQG